MIDVGKILRNMVQKNHIKELEQLANKEVLVGFPESARNDEGLSIAKYAKWNNYGTFTHDENGNATSRIPERPFFTKGFFFQKYVDRRNKLGKRLASNIKNGKLTANEACNMIGIEAVNNVRDSILNGPWAPNAPSVVKRKSAKTKGKKSKYGVKPLIDTGDMINAVTYIVKDKE